MIITSKGSLGLEKAQYLVIVVVLVSHGIIIIHALFLANPWQAYPHNYLILDQRIAFEEAVRHNLVVNIRWIRLIYMGLPRSGKTCFLRRILGEILNILDPKNDNKILDPETNEIVQPSTGVAKEKGMVITNAIVTNEKWSRLKDLNIEADMLSQFIDQLRTTGELILSPAFPIRQSIMADVLPLSDETLDLDRLKYELEGAIMLINTDTGGHTEFLDLHASLVHGPSFNLLFSKLTDSLLKTFKVEYTDESGKSYEEDNSATVEEVLFQALSSIACFSSDGAGNPKSKVMFVGTHRDCITKEEFIEKDRLLQEKIMPTEFFNVIEFASEKDDVRVEAMGGVDGTGRRSPDPTQHTCNTLMLEVNNRTGDQGELDRIRSRLREVITKSFDEIRIPISWLLLSIYIRRMDDYQIPYKRCEEIAARLTITPHDLKEVLHFLHYTLGVVLYYPEIEALRETVICKTQVVYDSATNLIKNTFISGNAGREAIQKFKETGMFSLKGIKDTSDDTGKLLRLPHLVKLLEHLNILTPVPQPDRDQEPTYFMPCVLKSIRTSELKPVCCESAPLLVHFKCGYIPTGVFPFIITKLVSGQHDNWKLIEEGLCKNMAQFHVQVEKDIDKVTLLSHPQYIEVAITRKPGYQDSTEIVCTKVRVILESILGQFKLGNLKKIYKLGFKCPDHPEENHLCIQLSNKKSSSMLCQQNPKSEKSVPLFPRHKVWFSKVDRPIDLYISTIAEMAKMKTVYIHYKSYSFTKNDFELYIGSGFAVENGEYVLTNAHVVCNTNLVNIQLNSGQIVCGEVTDVDEIDDLAVIKLPSIMIPPFEFCNCVNLLETVVAIGSPQALANTATKGEVTCVNRKAEDLGLTTRISYVQTNITMQQGYSGGPLVNMDGKVVAVTVRGMNNGISIAIPSTVATKFIKEANKSATQYTIGVSMETSNYEAMGNCSIPPVVASIGVLLTEVKHDSPADKAKLRKGDMVISVNGQTIVSAHGIYKAVRSGNPLNIVYYRKSERCKCTVDPEVIDAN